jgi:nucleotide-binding universal stress UspA family protein
VVAVDDSEHSSRAVRWAASRFATDANVDLRLVAVVHPLSALAGVPTAPLATSGTVSSVTQGYHRQKQDAEQAIKETLSRAEQEALKHGVRLTLATTRYTALCLLHLKRHVPLVQS